MLNNNIQLNTQVRVRDELPHLLLIIIIILLVYLWSAPRTVVLEDDGTFILAAYFNGIAHPPGYPLFTLISHLFTYLPIGSVAFRVHAVSSVFGALSCACMFMILRVLLPDRLYAYMGALCLAYSETFWSQSIIAEVYTLNSFIFLVLFFVALKLGDERNRFSAKTVYFMAFLYGLGLSDHWPLLILSTPGLLLVLWPRRKEIARCLPLSLVFLVLGLWPYLWMVVRSQTHPEISFFGPITSWSELWYIVSRKAYATADQNTGAGMWDKLMFCWFTLKQTLYQFGIPGGLLAAAGFLLQWRYWRRLMCLSLILIFLGSTFILIWLLGFDYDLLHRNIFRVYPVIAYAAIDVWLVAGVMSFINFICRQGRFFSIRKNYLQSAMLVFTVGTTLLFNIPQNYRAADNLAVDYARTVLTTLDKDAIFFTNGDVDTGPIGYLHLVEGVRPDVTVYSTQGLVFGNRLFDARFTDANAKHKILSRFLAMQKRPVYYTENLPRIYGYRDFGLYMKMDKSLADYLVEYSINQKIVDYYEGILNIKKRYDPWESMIQGALIADYCRLTANIILLGRDNSSFGEIHRVCRGYDADVMAVNVLLGQKKPRLDLIPPFLQQAKEHRGEAVQLSDYVQYDILYGRYLLLKNQPAAALKHFQQAINDWPDPGNKAYQLREHTQVLLGPGSAKRNMGSTMTGTTGKPGRVVKKNVEL